MNSATPAVNSAVGDTSTIYGVQHNYKAATDARDADVSRANAAKTFKLAMATLNQYVRDSVSSGVNLLAGDALRVTLNEKGSSQLFQVTNAAGAAFPISATSLGLVDSVGNSPDVTINNFATNYENGNAGIGLMNAIDKLDTSINFITSAKSQVASAESIVSDRKDFNAGLITLLNQSSNDLTAADLTDVGTKLAALQVQQSFAQTIMANTKQSDQSILQLLR
jgi:flagellin-like hook-associated protein FlgL